MPKVAKEELAAFDKVSFYNQQPWFEENECGKKIYQNLNSESDDGSNNEFDGDNDCFEDTLNEVYDQTSQLTTFVLLTVRFFILSVSKTPKF